MEYVDQHRDEMLNTWKTFVNHDSGFPNKAGVDSLQREIKNILEQAGAEVRFAEFEQAGNMLIGKIGPERQKQPVAFMGHCDTVFKPGTAEERPFTLKDGKVYGAGVLDMKGGVVALLYAIKALQAAGFDERPIKILLAGDEECGHLHSTTSDVFVQEAKGCLAAFNCETGFMDDGIVIGRKGVAHFAVEVHGVAAHVGNDPENGRSAILEMAHKIIAIEALNQSLTGTTVNVGVIEGGTVPNATPDYTKIVIDVRFVDEAGLQEFREKLQGITAKTHIAGTTTVVTEDASGFKPMVTTEGIHQLFAVVKSAAADCGLPIPHERKVGGGSDSAYSVFAGVPTVCAMGVKGGRNHSPEEFAVVESLFERAKLLAVSALRLNQLDKQ